MPASHHPFRNFIVLKDEVPFLIVNATPENVHRLVERFSRDTAHQFSYRPC
jgi:hypothetical protein